MMVMMTMAPEMPMVMVSEVVMPKMVMAQMEAMMVIVIVADGMPDR